MMYKIKRRYKPFIFLIDCIGYTLFLPFRPFKRKMDKGDIKRILIIRLDNIGDILVTTPSIRSLREKFKDAQIDILIKGYTKELVKNNPSIDNILVFDSPWLHRKGSLDVLSSLRFFLKNDLIKKLRNRRYDLILEFHTDPRNIILSFLIKGKFRVGHGIRGLGFLLTDVVPYEDNLHIIDKHASIVRYLGCSVRNKDTELFIEKRVEDKMRNLLNNYEGKRVCLNPGTGRINKYWFNEKWANLADKLVEKYKATIIFTGDKNDINDINEIISFMKNKKNCKIFAGKTSLIEAAALIKNCHLMISTDSGPLHLAKAVGIPVVGLYGPINPLEWAYKDKKSAFISGFKKCTCRYLPDCTRKTDRYLCMKSIAVEEVFKAAGGIISAG